MGFFLMAHDLFMKYRRNHFIGDISKKAVLLTVLMSFLKKQTRHQHIEAHYPITINTTNRRSRMVQTAKLFHHLWTILFESLDRFSEDFMECREQPGGQQQREEMFE